MYKPKEHSLFGQRILLLPDRALFWRKKRLLIVADPHFGKGQVFRDGGVAVPSGTTVGDLNRLSYLIDHFQPGRLLFLGDLIHDRIHRSAEFNRLIEQWRHRHKNVQLMLVTGNHDRRCGEATSYFDFDQTAAKILFDPFVFSHKPKIDSLFYVIAGHLHPSVTVTGKGRQKENLPCFCFGPQAALLPAFGSFTGNQVIRPTSDDRIYVVAGDEVLEVQNNSLSK